MRPSSQDESLRPVRRQFARMPSKSARELKVQNRYMITPSSQSSEDESEAAEVVDVSPRRCLRRLVRVADGEAACEAACEAAAIEAAVSTRQGVELVAVEAVAPHEGAEGEGKLERAQVPREGGEAVCEAAAIEAAVSTRQGVEQGVELVAVEAVAPHEGAEGKGKSKRPRVDSRESGRYAYTTVAGREVSVFV